MTAAAAAVSATGAAPPAGGPLAACSISAPAVVPVVAPVPVVAASAGGAGRAVCVPRVPVPAAARLGAGAPVAGFLEEGDYTAPDASPTVLACLPVSRDMLIAACMGATGVPLARLRAWSDDEVRGWALFEVFGPGALRAMNRMSERLHADAWTHQPRRARFLALLTARIDTAFGFTTASSGHPAVRKEAEAS